jgi:hypothetical protein
MLILSLLCLGLAFITSIWALVIIFKRTIVGGLLSLFLGFPMLYFLVTGWGKEGQDIKLPFFLSLIFGCISYGVAISAAQSMIGDELQKVSTPPGQSAPSMRDMPRETPRSQESLRVSNPPAAAPPAAPAYTPAPPPQRPSLYTETPAQRPAQEPRRPKAAQSNCVYKPVMTDEDMAKCR